MKRFALLLFAVVALACQDMPGPQSTDLPVLATSEQDEQFELLFGPVQFVRSEGEPVKETVEITSPDFEHFTDPFRLRLKNGDEDGGNRISSAYVWLDDTEIFRPSDFSQQVGELTADVTVNDGSVLGVELRSRVGSYVTIRIEAPLRPGRARIGSEGGTVVSADGQATLEVPAGAITDAQIFFADPYSGDLDPQAVAGTAYELGPDGTDFEVPAVLTLSFDRLKVSEPENLEIRTLVQSAWTRVETSAPVEGQDAVSATLQHLSPFLIADTEFDAVDLVLFETLQWIAEQEQSFSLWAEPGLAREYVVSQMPVYFIRRDDNDVTLKAYLVNFPSPPTGALEVHHAFPDLGTVHRYDGEMNELHAAATFDFDLDLSGRPTYAIAYKPQNMDRTPLTNTANPYTRLDVWVDLFVHEGFHHYQFHAPSADWLSLAFGGLLTADYPVTSDNVALALLEREALLDGRSSATAAHKAEVLRRLLAIRQTRVQLPEAAPDLCRLAATPKTHGQGSSAPDGVGQSFTACETGEINSIRVDVLALDDPNARLELQTGTDSWPGSHVQDVVLVPGENVIPLDVPFPVDAGVVYSFALFPSTGQLSLWSAEDSYAGGEAFFVVNSSRVGITPSPDLVFGLTVEGPNYVDRMDRYQERNEGSAEHVARRLFVLSGSAVYAQERLEQLERGMQTDYQTSRDQLMNTFFRGGWYQTGSTILDLVDEVSNISWRTTFPAGGSPIEVLQTLYGPLTQAEIDQLVDDAKQAYDWQAILAQVAAIPPQNLDPTP